MIINKGIKPDIERELKWKEYIAHIDHYRYYLTIALQCNVFFYTVTGVVLGVYLNKSNETSQPLLGSLLGFLLLLPILLGASLGGMFVYGGNLWEKAYNNIANITEALSQTGFDVENVPDFHLLRVFLKIFGYIFFGVGALLTLLPCLAWYQTSRNVAWYRAFPRQLFIFVSIALVFMLVGVLIPFIANRVDEKLKEQRIRDQQKLLNNWISHIESTGFDNASVDDGAFFHSLRRYLDQQTVKSFYDGTLTQDSLLDDLRKLEKK